MSGYGRTSDFTGHCLFDLQPLHNRHRPQARAAFPALRQDGRELRRGVVIVERKLFSRAGIYVFGATAVALGAIGFAWSDFATSWQRVGPGVPHRELLAWIAALVEVCGGLAIFWRRTARAGAAILTLLYGVFVALWLARVAVAPGTFDNWGNVFEELSLVIAGLVLCAALAPRDSPWAGREALISRLYGICVVSFGLAHFIYLSGAASFVPKWIPPGGTFWAATTGACFLLAALAILTGIQAVLASRLLTTMIVLFEILVWAPRLFTTPHDHFSWSGNGICLVLAGAAWVVSDSIREQRNSAGAPQRSEA
jgi:uncharacterized membrane protein